MIFKKSEVCIGILVKKIVEFLEKSFHDACGSFTNEWAGMNRKPEYF